jgi:hypothetical protein
MEQVGGREAFRLAKSDFTHPKVLEVWGPTWSRSDRDDCRRAIVEKAARYSMYQ